MAFGGIQASRLFGVAADGLFVNYMKIDALTLLAYIGAPNIAAGDTGELTTAVPVVNQNDIPNGITFGKGRGNWAAGDEFRVKVTIQDGNGVRQVAATGDTSLAHMVTAYPQVAAGDLLIRIHNRGNQNTGPLQIWLQYIADRA